MLKPPTWRIWLFDTCNCINITIKNIILLFYRVYNYKGAKIIRDEKLRIDEGEFEFERFFVSKMREMWWVFIDWILKQKEKKKWELTFVQMASILKGNIWRINYQFLKEIFEESIINS